MTDSELVDAIRALANDPKRRTYMAARFGALGSFRHAALLPPPTTLGAVQAAEIAVGFAFPNFLVRLWTEAANGGFGPGYGLFGLEGGHREDLQRMTAEELYLQAVEDEAWDTVLEGGWPKRLVPICDWGCGQQSAIDCTTPVGEVEDLIDGFEQRHKGMDFTQWMQAWVNGVDLWFGC